MRLIKKVFKIQRMFFISILSLLLISACGKSNNNTTDNSVDTTLYNVDTNGAVLGDWIILHEVADAEGMNPVTTNDAAASEIQSYIYETLNNIDPITYTVFS
jgi:hypothetical protein